MNPRRRLACAAGLSFLVTGLSGCAEDEPVLRLGESIRHDDFLYTALAAQFVPRIGEHTARGQFLIVHFEVTNRAGRVSHEWANDIAFLVDARGRRYENDPDLQRTLDRWRPFGWAATYLTRAESSQRTMLVFDVPADTPRPLDLMVRGELLMGDVLDGVRFRRARVRLP